MASIVEAGGQYPRWRGGGPLRGGPPIHVIAIQEIKTASRDLVFLLGAAAAVFLASNSVFNLIGDQFHTEAQFLFSMQNALWAAVAVSAVLAGPRLVDDVRQGALELYLTRAVTRTEYLLGKISAVFGLAFLTVLVTGFLYYGATLMLFEEHPDGWALVPLGIFAAAIIWGLLVAGVGLAIASLTKNSRVALLSYIGLFLVFGLLLPYLLEWVTDDAQVWILSPVMALLSQSPWLFGFTSEDVAFPMWWGLLEVAALTVAGWAIFLWRRPRVRGEGVKDDRRPEE